MIWLLLASVYVIPGYYKIFGSTEDQILEFVYSDSLRYKLTRYWYLKGIDPIVRLDLYPRLCQFGALRGAIDELAGRWQSCPSPLRVPLAIATVLFHTMTSWLMGISFPHLRL